MRNFAKDRRTSASLPPEGHALRPAASPATDQPSAAIDFAVPTRFALITTGGRSWQRLVGIGDALQDPADPSHLVTLQQAQRAPARQKVYRVR